MKRVWNGVVRVLVLVLVLVLCGMPRTAFAQARDGKLIVTVADPSGAVIPGATVTIVGLEDLTKKAVIPPAKTNDKGVVQFDGVVIGRYSIQADFPGFDLGLLRDIRIKSGDNKHVVVLPLKKMESSVTVGQDKQTAAVERNAVFGSALTREQIAALSDNPDELRQQLQDMAGPDAVFRVDSFEGADLPAKSQIKSIHITRDTFAAENHQGGGLFIDIITQPGQGKLRVNTNYNLSGSKLTATDEFTGLKAPANNQNAGGGLSGSLIKDKSSFSINMNGGKSYQQPNVYAHPPNGLQSTTLNLKTRNDNFGLNGLLDYAITRDQTLRFSINGNKSTAENQGVGAYDLPGRAFSTDSHSFSFRVQEAGPLGRRFFINTRLQFGSNTSAQNALIEAMTYRVQDAFTSGGAQVTGGTRRKNVNLASDLDYVKGINSWRAGVQLDGAFYDSDAVSNYLGTYTFTSNANFDLAKPSTFTRQVGDPLIKYNNLNAGFYVQDDLRVRKNLTLSPGVRYEVQTHLSDYNAISPRFGVTWSPFKSGRTSIQASAGIFHEWMSTGVYQQTLQNDGEHLLLLNVSNPAFPDPGPAGDLSPTDKDQLGAEQQMQEIHRVSAGLNQQISPRVRVNMNYSFQKVADILSGVNLNAPVNGVRPNPAFVNIIETQPNSRSRQHQVSTNVNLSFAAPSAALNQARFNWRRTGVNVNYNWRHSEMDALGAFGVSPSGTLATEWGPGPEDIHHRWLTGINTQALKNMNANININGSTGAPYNETTGVDNNGDLIFNDRPAGVSRNALRMPGQWGVNANINYNIGFGKQPGSGGSGGGKDGPISINGGAAGGLVMVQAVGGGVIPPEAARLGFAGGGQGAPRYNFFVSVNINNLTNHVNLAGYNGNMQSPFFMQPTSGGAPRRVSVSMGLGF